MSERTAKEIRRHIAMLRRGEVGIVFADELEFVLDAAVKLRKHLGVICAVFSSFGMEMLPEVAKLWTDTAWLEDLPDADMEAK